MRSCLQTGGRSASSRATTCGCSTPCAWIPRLTSPPWARSRTLLAGGRGVCCGLASAGFRTMGGRCVVSGALAVRTAGLATVHCVWLHPAGTALAGVRGAMSGGSSVGGALAVRTAVLASGHGVRLAPLHAMRCASAVFWTVGSGCVIGGALAVRTAGLAPGGRLRAGGGGCVGRNRGSHGEQQDCQQAGNN